MFYDCGWFASNPTQSPRLDVDGEVLPELEGTFHIVELVNAADGNSVQLLFREIDLYFVAFRPLTKGSGPRPQSTSGWFRFKENERIVPSFIESDEIYYGYGYGELSNSRVGDGTLNDIYHCLRRFTKDNAKMKSDQRKRVLKSCCLMFAETQRFVQMQQEVMENLVPEKLLQGNQANDIDHLIGLFHDWITESRKRASIADLPEAEAVALAAAEQASSSSLDRRLWVLKYDDEYFLPLIERQQQQQEQQHQEEEEQQQQPLTRRQQKQQLQQQLLQLRHLRQRQYPLRLLRQRQHQLEGH